MSSKPAIRKGKVFAPSGIESMILDGMRSTSSLHRDGPKFYAGDVAHCPRRAVKFLTTDRNTTISPSSTVYMKLGNTIHEIISDALFKADALIFKEFRLPPSEDPDIRGIIDNIFFASGNKVMGMEVKSCGNIPASPKRDHIDQATMYSAVVGLEFVVVYVSRKVAGFDGKLMIKSFELECTERDMLNALTKACLASYAHRDGVLPPIPTGFTKADCGFCPFIDECWDEEPMILPEAKPAHVERLYEEAEARARVILGERVSRRNGIIKHLQRYTSPSVQKRLDELIKSAL